MQKYYGCFLEPVILGHESGSTVKKQSKTHFMANKDLKCVLSMGARAAIRHDPDIKAYAERKAKEGKSYAWIKTAVCNKLLKGILSCVNNQKYYEKSKKANNADQRATA